MIVPGLPAGIAMLACKQGRYRPGSQTEGQMKSATVARVNLRHLRAFVLVAETGTVRAAAEEAGLSQPAVTQGLARLEQHFGLTLFQRSHSGMRMSEYGAVLRARTAACSAAAVLRSPVSKSTRPSAVSKT